MFPDIIRRLKSMDYEIEKLKIFEVAKYNPQATAVSSLLSINALRAAWPMNSRDEVPKIMDLSGQGRSLSYSGTLTTGQVNGLGEYIQTDDTHYAYRANEVGIQNNSFSLGGWFYFADITPNTFYRIAGKDAAAANKSYEIFGLDANGAIGGEVSTDGTNVVSARVVVPSVGWHFIGMTKASNVLLRTYCDLNSTDNTTSIPATVFANTNQLKIGKTYSGTGYPNGRVMYWFYTSAFIGITTWTAVYEATRGVLGV